MTNALDLAEELIVLRALKYGQRVLAAPEYLAMTNDQVCARIDVVEKILREIKVNDDVPPKASMTAGDFL